MTSRRHPEVPGAILARLRKACLALPEVREEQAWVGIRWRIRQETFAHVLTIAHGWPPVYARAAGTDGPVCVLTFQSLAPRVDPQTFSQAPWFRPLWRPDIVGRRLGGREDWDDIARLLTASYCLLAPKKLAAAVRVAERDRRHVPRRSAAGVVSGDGRRSPGLHDSSLPAWIYTDPQFFELERQKIFRQAWHIVGHVSDAPRAGDYVTLDILGERVVTLRGADGTLRSFHNVCRHRAAKLAPQPRGTCGPRLVCPYHAWSYTLDGRLAGVPSWQGFEDLDTAAHGLKPVEQEIFHGFIFVRFAAGLPGVAEMMAPYAAELEPYALEALVPQGRVTLRPRPVNWKNVADNYSDGLHIGVAHPGLSRLFGSSYRIEAREWVDKMSGELQQTASANWSERAYQGLLPALTQVPHDRPRQWTYYKLWPNVAFDVYPDQVDFMQFIPVSPTETLIREIAYVHPHASRELKAARYLNWRINRQVNAEDTALIEGVQGGMASSSYTSGPLSPKEVCLLSFANRMRALIPEARLDRAPPGRQP